MWKVVSAVTGLVCNSDTLCAILGPAVMFPSSTPLLQSLSWTTYPRIITTAVRNIAHGTAVTYQIPTRITRDLHALTELYNVYLHCIVSRFQSDENQHTLVFLDRNYRGEIMVSPDYSV